MTTLPLNAKLAGKYNLVVKHADGSTTETGWFDNLILDSGLDLVGLGTAVQFSFVGAGASTPVASQAQLDSQIGGYGSFTFTGVSSVNSGSPNYVATLTWPFHWAQGAVVGNVSEIGIGPNTSGNGLFSRALILDNVGSPTTLSLVSTDQLTAYYALSFTPNTSDTTGSVVIAGVTYNYTMRLANAASFVSSYPYLVATSGAIGILQASQVYVYGSDATLGPITGQPSASSSATGCTVTPASYGNGTYHLDNVLSMTISQCNVTGGIKAILLPFATGSSIVYKVLFDTPIPKTALNTLSLTFRFAWSA